jgi:hypothetical protein
MNRSISALLSIGVGLMPTATLSGSGCQDDTKKWYGYCTADSQCGSDLFCAVVATGYDFCTSACDSDAQCQNSHGTQYANCGSDGLCYRSCVDTDECPGDATCDGQICLVLELPNGPRCGDNLAEGDEYCDGNDLRGQTCADFGYLTGTLSCYPDCWYDMTGCAGSSSCGNGLIEAGEECDGMDVAGVTCADVVAGGAGTISCSPDCTYDISDCRVCGNGVVEFGEA